MSDPAAFAGLGIFFCGLRSIYLFDGYRRTNRPKSKSDI